MVYRKALFQYVGGRCLYSYESILWCVCLPPTITPGEAPSCLVVGVGVKREEGREKERERGGDPMYSPKFTGGCPIHPLYLYLESPGGHPIPLVSRNFQGVVISPLGSGYFQSILPCHFLSELS